MLRAIEAFPERTADSVHFEEAARTGRVLVSNDDDQLKLAIQWIASGRHFAGLVTWPQTAYVRARASAFVRAFEALAEQDGPLGNYPIVHLKPRT